MPLQVLLALEYLQDQRIAHRDVRSDNLLLNAAGVLKIGESVMKSSLTTAT